MFLALPNAKARRFKRLLCIGPRSYLMTMPWVCMEDEGSGHKRSVVPNVNQPAALLYSNIGGVDACNESMAKGVPRKVDEIDTMMVRRNLDVGVLLVMKGLENHDRMLRTLQSMYPNFNVSTYHSTRSEYRKLDLFAKHLGRNKLQSKIMYTEDIGRMLEDHRITLPHSIWGQTLTRTWDALAETASNHKPLRNQQEDGASPHNSPFNVQQRS
ncbi:uncharacterized protein EV420DRAFT_1673022 [Desarmillaria tabescens]|uniref:Uncharacterized protein n=1 Tax=Armillaria tabescens TaxID=1929756 RepID=A0AA39KFI5_ARMTA|nr:uncharacterized protein EV420DRAFT_1673022 [Desarmillaria tabescens]KAK0460077.1 hypothetical protein EV420DRAFT_1673022 [Desarmillaria tabescens]